jgi:hypothetical protein
VPRHIEAGDDLLGAHVPHENDRISGRRDHPSRVIMESVGLLESSLTWAEFWATMACGAVALGLLIEYRSELKKTFAEKNLKLLPIGALLVTLGVMPEFAFQIRTSFLVAEVRSIQQQHVSAANERATNAEKEAAEAKLALARMNAPRKLTPDRMEALVALLKQKAGKSFWVMTQKSPTSRFGEQTDFAKQITEAFTVAGWKKDAHFSRENREEEMAEFTAASDRGCLVEGAQPELIKFVWDQLKLVEIHCDVVENPDYEQDFVFIEIGLR